MEPVVDKPSKSLTNSSYADPNHKDFVTVIPADVAQIIFAFLNDRERAVASHVCRRWHAFLKIKKLYLLGQLKGRVLILKNIYFYHSSEFAQNFLNRANLFLADKPEEAASLEKIVSPLSPKVFKATYKEISTKMDSLTNHFNEVYCERDLCVIAQRLIDIAMQQRFKFQSQSSVGFYSLEVNCSSPYEVQAVCDALAPCITAHIDIALPNGCFSWPRFACLPTRCSLPLFAAIMSAVAESGKLKQINLHHPMEKCSIEDLEFLKKTLPKSIHVEQVSFDDSDNDLFWSRFEYLQDALCEMPALTKISFERLKPAMTVQQAKILADIIKKRSQSKKCKKIHEVIFRGASIGREGIEAFIDAMADYAYPIAFTFAELEFINWGNLNAVFDFRKKNPYFLIQLMDMYPQTVFVRDPKTGDTIKVTPEKAASGHAKLLKKLGK